MTYIEPVVHLILARGGLSFEPAPLPINVYTKTKYLLFSSILDEN